MIDGIFPGFPGTGPGEIRDGGIDKSFYNRIPASLAFGASYIQDGSCLSEPAGFIFFSGAHKQKLEGSGTTSTDNESGIFNGDELDNEEDTGNADNIKSGGFLANSVNTPASDGNVSGAVNVGVSSHSDVASTGFISLQHDVAIGDANVDNAHTKDLAFNRDVVTPQNVLAHPRFNNPVYEDLNNMSAYSTIPSLSNTPSLSSNNGYPVAEYSVVPEFPGVIMGFNGTYGYPELKFCGLEGNKYPVIPNFGFMPNLQGYGNYVTQMTPNSTIDGESIVDDMDEPVGPDGTVPPVNKRDPIYTAISGLKWKAKSKKWVVRWDNPVTNRRVYKYFSGTRYGFMGAHKRAKYYLEFLNASVGRIPTPSSGNPFCRRTEGPPKGKTNKGLLRKVSKPFPAELRMDHQLVPSSIDPRVFLHNASEVRNVETDGMSYLGSSARNPWCTNGLIQQRKCSDVQQFYV